MNFSGVPFRVNGQDAEQEEMMASAIRSVFGHSTPVYRGGIGSTSTEPVPGGIEDIQALHKAGDQALKARKYTQALEKFRESVQLLVGKDTKIPLSADDEGGVICDAYTKMELFSRVSLQGSCRGVAEALVGLGRYEEALSWFEEVEVLESNMRLTLDSENLFDWLGRTPQDPNYFRQRILSSFAASQLFLKIGNTGAAVHRQIDAQRIRGCIRPPINSQEMAGLYPADAVMKISKLRHPDPKTSAKLEVKEERLQVRGSWRKIELKRPLKITARMGVAHFVWRSRFYVLGGERDSDGPWWRDFWYIDLERLHDGWHSLPEYPLPKDKIPEVSGWHMGVHADRAYLFRGSKKLEVFDLVTEKWYSLKTTCEQVTVGSSEPFKWTCALPGLRDFAMQIVDGKMYVFGGTHDRTGLGCNQFAVLDLSTHTWRHLSGESVPRRADMRLPGPRRLPAMWTDGKGERIWLMFGEADRLGAQMSGEPNGSTSGWGYADFWSWGIKEEKWRRERLVGNPPCARSEVGCTFNEKLDSTIIFGGYHPMLPTEFVEEHQYFSFTYYADTFIYTPDETGARRWKHVLTRGYPTYRAQAVLFSDPATGRTFLFGGYINSEFVPDGKHIVSRAFNDLWELRLDVPGGHFEGVDLDEEARTASVGPWKRCFNCGSAGPWKKCGGSCNGRVFFCDLDCLKEGWREHKQKHRCAKK